MEIANQKSRAPEGIMLKRIFDIVAAGLGMVVLLVPILILIILVRNKLGSPVFFCQTRSGMNGKPFKIVKFRTMLDMHGADGHLLPDAERLTLFGSWLRSTSLDELPELWNVVKGEMSLVGPRPLLMSYLERYSTEQTRRHLVRPGLTGWAQVNGRNGLSWEEKFKLDVWYVDHWSFWFDIKILCYTVKKVIKREGIGAEGDVTMPEFKGCKDVK
jgi:lipopolysaccharide/colanic/teichoic acid biosynthesis glycosyltransferase